MKIKDKRVAVLMSGGVDSSVAAHLLKKRGFDVIGVTLHLWDYESAGRNPKNEKGCCDISSQLDAKFVCSQLGIKHVVLDLRNEFQKNVVKPYELTYLSGETPNPCVWCNSKIKWGSVINKAAALEYDYIATGHYARIIRGKNGVRLEKGVDPLKDQSYALWEIPRDILAKTILPLGSWTKDKIRKEANSINLRTANKPDSQEVCFIDDHYENYLRDKFKEKIGKIGKGKIIFRDGKTIGTHNGFFSYTIGQRRGLNISDGQGPYYVTSIEAENNIVRVGNNDDLKAIGLIAKDCNWLSFGRPANNSSAVIKIRYNDSGSPGFVKDLGNGSVEICFKKPQRAVTPGQSVVWYKGKAVWGGGIIAEAIKE